MDLAEAIAVLNRHVTNPTEGLPQDVFLYISKVTPLVNVDLLIKDEKGRTLLSWRDDKYTGTGWHVPGGIIRFKEKLETRVRKVAEIEIGRAVDFDPVPVEVHQSIYDHAHDIRSHFISFLYKCYLPSSFVPENKGLSDKDAGYLMWHKDCPKDLLECQRMYCKYF